MRRCLTEPSSYPVLFCFVNWLTQTVPSLISRYRLGETPSHKKGVGKKETFKMRSASGIDNFNSACTPFINAKLARLGFLGDGGISVGKSDTYSKYPWLL